MFSGQRSGEDSKSGEQARLVFLVLNYWLVNLLENVILLHVLPKKPNSLMTTDCGFCLKKY